MKYGRKTGDNIDFFHIHQAYHTIEKWFAGSGEDEDNFRGRLSESYKFIWYDLTRAGREMLLKKRFLSEAKSNLKCENARV
jgi:hypothetical protein